MKAAILGMGAMGQVHIQVYESLGIDVFVYDPKNQPLPNHDRVGAVADAIVRADIVSICSPDDFHADQIIFAFKAGKHVFCEKPLCHTRKEFEAIKAAYNKDCALGMNFPLRWHKPFVEAKARLPELGHVYLIEADYEYGRLGKYEMGWRGNMEDYDLVMGGGLHMIDVARWITELPVELRDRQHFWTHRCYATVGIGRLGGGGIFKLTCDFGGYKNHARRLRICGTKDSLYIDDREPTDKSRALREFVHLLRKKTLVPASKDLPTPEEIFRVHEIGLSL